MKLKHIYLIFIIGSILVACEKDIDVEVPGSEERLVVEGSIEQGWPPLIFLTRTSDFFEPTDLNTLRELTVHDAKVTVSDGTNSFELIEVCSDDIPPSLLPVITQLVGITTNDIINLGLCLYTTLDPNAIGQVGKKYDLLIEAEGKILTSTTTIPELVFMDRYFYRDQVGLSDLGYLWFNLNDPPEFGNSYRIYTQRQGKDDRFIPADGSVFDDGFFNGLDFEAFIFGGHDLGGEFSGTGYFEQGDVVYVKFCSIDQPHFQFWNSFEIATFNNGNPFAAPATIRSNINGGLGIWGGYASTFDTLVLAD